MLAWTPFLEPCNALQSVWYLLLIPLSLGISLMYRAIREAVVSDYWRSVIIMTVQIVVVIAALGVGLGLVVEFLIPLLSSP
ncbi:MAG: hypothetical protein VX615_03530 [Planctomycetota bacterium]|nr:hypothetical protein [Planctomycetota bacterium]